MHRFALLLFILVLLACSSGSPKLEGDIAALETKLAEQPSQEVLIQLQELYQEMANNSRGEERLEYLWKSGETARAAKNFALAESVFIELSENQENLDLASKALFLHAFMCDEDLKEYDKASVLYRKFLEKYPDSDFADDAQFLLENLGKTDEEMLEILNRSRSEEVQ